MKPNLTERQEKVIALRAEGFSFGEIAIELSVSRAAISGFFFRNPQYKPKTTPPRQKPTRHTAKPQPKPEVRQPLAAPAVIKLPVFKPPRAIPLSPPPPEGALTLFECCAGRCRYPYGEDPKTMMFCGNECDVTQPYCPGHRAIAWVKAARPKASPPGERVPHQSPQGSWGARRRFSGGGAARLLEPEY